LKLKITIAGERVQEVGYRLHLLSLAKGLVGFEAENVDQDKLVVYVEGDDIALTRFREAVEKSRPPLAKVSSIAFEPFDGFVLSISEYRQQLSLEQLVKIAQTGLEVRGDIKEMKGDIKEMKGDIKEMKGDIKEMKGDIKEMKGDIKEMKGDIKEMKGDIKEIKSNTEEIKQDTKDIKADLTEVKGGLKRISETQDEILSEVRGMRTDLRTYLDERLKRLEADVKIIKEKLGLSP
jgi:acylphosphatase/septal ring factor EnvC (AmiA/AmiB activator)